MANLFFLDAKCAKNGSPFYIRYDLAADGVWVMSYGVKELPSGEGTSSGSSKEDVSNSRIGPQYKCPSCGNRNFVECNNCKKLTCYDNSGRFTCKHCGRSGTVSGYITSISTTRSGSGQ